METPNLNYVNQLAGGDTTFKNKLIEVIKTEFPLEKAQYLESFKAKNHKLSAENVHKLKHKISILGLEKSYKIAEIFEDNLKEGSTRDYEKFDTILETIARYLKTL
jgi:HPt (histidine-containing phosphotransfer) domain-containing protein